MGFQSFGRDRIERVAKHNTSSIVTTSRIDANASGLLVRQHVLH